MQNVYIETQVLVRGRKMNRPTFVNYKIASDCYGDSVIYNLSCQKCGRCGRHFDKNGLMLRDSILDSVPERDEFTAKRKKKEIREFLKGIYR